MKNVLVIGGCGFIGSHIVDRLLEEPQIDSVAVYDNLSSGKREHLDKARHDRRLYFIRADISEEHMLKQALQGMDTVFHLAANPDIARAVKEPTIDFTQGTVLLQTVLEAMRLTHVHNLYYMSGSGVYGDRGQAEVVEDMPLKPISTYGASKAACECLISAYCHLFRFHAACFRFANVVGDRQTHGVGYDFIRKLRQNPNELEILGDGSQSKSYLHVSDAVRAIFATPLWGFEAYNAATYDYLTVREIAGIVANKMELNPKYKYTGGERGWLGDVPVVRFNSDKLRTLGWKPIFTSRDAMEWSIADMLCAL